jgi:hypothetical protein
MKIHERTTDAAEALYRRMSPKIRVFSLDDRRGFVALSGHVGRRRAFERGARRCFVSWILGVRKECMIARLQEKLPFELPEICETINGIVLRTLWSSNMDRATTDSIILTNMPRLGGIRSKVATIVHALRFASDELDVHDSSR